jgi:hypothetical protein
VEVRWWGSGVVVGVFSTPNFFSTRYHSGMDTEKRELWGRLQNEAERAKVTCAHRRSDLKRWLRPVRHEESSSASPKKE